MVLVLVGQTYIDHASEVEGESGHGENYEHGGDATGVNESDKEYCDEHGGDDSDGVIRTIIMRNLMKR